MLYIIFYIIYMCIIYIYMVVSLGVTAPPLRFGFLSPPFKNVMARYFLKFGCILCNVVF